MNLFIPSLSPRPISLRGVDIGISADKLAEDPLVFQKMNAEIGGNGWAPDFYAKSVSIDDPRWGQPWIYPGTGNIDWKWLKGDKYVFVFTDSNLTAGFWQERSFFDDVNREGWIRSKSWKYYGSTPSSPIRMPEEPWILRFANTTIGKAIMDYGESAKPIVQKIVNPVGDMFGGLSTLIKYAPYIIGGYFLLKLFRRR